MPQDRKKEQALGHLLEECSTINRYLTAAARELTQGSSVTGAQWGILGVFGGPEGPFSVAEAARRIGKTRQSVQGVADLLSEKELIEYQPDPNHRRVKLVMVTDEGRALLRQFRARQTRWTRRVAHDLKTGDIETALRLIRQIHQHLADQV